MFSSSAAIFDSLYSFRDMRAEARRALALARRASGRPITSALDVGCATGDHAAHLLDAGVREVEGLDVDAKLLILARRKHPRVRFRRADMTSVRLGRSFDAIFSFYGVIAYVRTLRGLRRFAENVARHLNSGGVAVIEPWHLADTYAPRPAARHVLGGEHAIARASVVRVRGRSARMTVHYLEARGARVRHLEEVHRLGLFTRRELLEALRDVGLETSWADDGPSDRGALLARKLPSSR